MAFFLPKALPLILPHLVLLVILSPSLSVVVVVISEASAAHPDIDATYRWCGSLNFSYPFSLYNSESESASVCGYPDLTVICKDGNTPLLPLGISSNLSIGNIDVNRSIIHLDNPDAPRTTDVSYCPTITQGITLPAGSILNKTTNDVDLTFFYGCNGSLPPSFSPIQCLTSSYIFVGATLPPGYNYDQMCSQIIKTIAILPAAALESINVTFLAALKDGFDLTWKWDSPECKQCEQSGGWCSYTQSDLTFFTCFNSSKDCRGDIGQNKTSHRRLIIIGTTLGAGCFLLCCIIFLSYKHHKKKQGNIKPNKYHEMEHMKKYGLPFVPQMYTFSQIKWMTGSFVEKLGQGGYGSVYKGTLPDGSQIAVKVFKDYKGNGEDFVTEVNAIARTAHVNIVSLFGFAIKGSQRALVYEFMPNGSLDKYLGQRRYKKFTEFGYERLLNIAVGIAQGLEYLHRGCSTRIIHLDIKPHNILLDQDFQPKISDFGLAKFCRPDEGSILMSNMRGTIGYIAPEVFSRNYGQVSTKSDVYSYGMLLIEMSGGKENRMEADEDSISTSNTYFPNWVYQCIEETRISGTFGISNVSEKIVTRMMIIGLWCTQTMPELRPSMGEVLQMLEGRLEDLTPPPKHHISFPVPPVSFTIDDVIV
ncbi:Protein kinase family protein [Rhynchospora pubera]|uniref:Protein kinase family protein n=1 Tax=Rhynchospora pubera TaxID=906938 RepID=A0AAV8DRJ6_9POAL|nr:Protein kinase family protein [Rhynchospora pubera]